jgi:hypothetical protein
MTSARAMILFFIRLILFVFSKRQGQSAPAFAYREYYSTDLKKLQLLFIIFYK